MSRRICPYCKTDLTACNFTGCYGLANTIDNEIHIRELEAREAQWLSSSHAMAVRLLGQEQYDNSPCQAHPLELVEGRFRELQAELEMVKAEGIVARAEAKLLFDELRRVLNVVCDVQRLKAALYSPSVTLAGINIGIPHHGKVMKRN